MGGGRQGFGVTRGDQPRGAGASGGWERQETDSRRGFWKESAGGSPAETFGLLTPRIVRQCVCAPGSEPLNVWALVKQPQETETERDGQPPDGPASSGRQRPRRRDLGWALGPEPPPRRPGHATAGPWLERSLPRVRNSGPDLRAGAQWSRSWPAWQPSCPCWGGGGSSPGCSHSPRGQGP